jgi:hypothetical protein
MRCFERRMGVASSLRPSKALPRAELCVLSGSQESSSVSGALLLARRRKSACVHGVRCGGVHGVCGVGMVMAADHCGSQKISGVFPSMSSSDTLCPHRHHCLLQAVGSAADAHFVWLHACNAHTGDIAADHPDGEAAAVAALTRGQPPVELLRVYAVLGAVLSGSELCLLVCTKARRTALPEGCDVHTVRKVRRRAHVRPWRKSARPPFHTFSSRRNTLLLLCPTACLSV